MLAQFGLPFEHWIEAFAIAFILSIGFHHRSSFEVLLSRKPNYLSFKVFGCLCYPHFCPFNSYKFEFRSASCNFLGYISQHKSYKCLHQSRKIFVSCHVMFDEKQFPLLNLIFIPLINPIHLYLYHQYLHPYLFVFLNSLMLN